MADPVWMMVMFDLPVLTREQRRRANKYRHLLLDLGFAKIQLSVYAKYLVNASGVRPLLGPIKSTIPPNGAVRVLRLTDEQWSATYRFEGPHEVPVEPRPSQLALFPVDETDEILLDDLLRAGLVQRPTPKPRPTHRGLAAPSGTPRRSGTSARRSSGKGEPLW